MDTDKSAVGEEWIVADEALKRLCSTGSNPVAVKEMIADYLRDGGLKARADTTWLSDFVNLTDAMKCPEEDKTLKADIIIPARHWRSDKCPAEDRQRWRWPVSVFYHTTRIKPRRRRIFRGVRFSKEDLSILFPELFSSSKPKRGRKKNDAARDAGWLKLIEIMLEPGWASGSYHSANELYEDVKTRLQDKNGTLPLGENQISEICRMTFKRFQGPYSAQFGQNSGDSRN